MRTSLFNNSMFSVELKKPKDELTKEGYYNFLVKKFNELISRNINCKDEKVFLTLRINHQKNNPSIEYLG